MTLSRILAQAGILFFVVSVSSLSAAFQGPIAPPPAGNVPAPLNTGVAFQQKLGAFWAASIGTDAGYCIKNACITDWSQAGKTLSCPSGFTRIGKGDRTFGCVGNVTQKNTYEGAVLSCFEGAGARLPSYAELVIIKSALGVTLPADMWLDGGSSQPASATASFRCFIGGV